MKENSIKEDIKILEKKIEDYEPYKNIEYCSHAGQILQEEHKAIEHILSDYKRVLKENEELKEIYRSEKKMKNEYVKLYQDLLLKENVIPIQKIKDKIEELNSRIEIYRKYVEQGVETDVEWVDNVADRETVKVLQELIEESEEK